jgi:hypothetical protein
MNTYMQFTLICIVCQGGFLFEKQSGDSKRKVGWSIPFFIYAHCQNNYLVELLRTTWDRLEVRGHTDFSYILQRILSSMEEHTQLLDMIERHASQNEIEQTFREHKLRTYEAYRKSPCYENVMSSVMNLFHEHWFCHPLWLRTHGVKPRA